MTPAARWRSPVYAFIAFIALDRAEVVEAFPGGFSIVGMWVAFAYFVLGIGLNAISRSKRERFTMVPVTVVLAALSLPIALG